MKNEPHTANTQSFLDGVLPEELRLLQRRRGLETERRSTPPPSEVEDDVPQAVREAQDVSAFGLAFSGGGIRSATFNLGVSQALAEKNLLERVDYLSTVSGGGYIGSWLHGVIRSHHPDDPAASASSASVFEGVNRTLLTGIAHKPATPDADPIAFLRKYSNYLSPKTGLFSADTWVIGVIWLRNVLLNQLILAPAIAALAALVLLLVLLRQISWVDASNLGFNPVSAMVALAGFVAAVVVMAANLRPIARQSISTAAEENDTGKRSSEKFVSVVVLGVFIASLGLALGDFDPSRPLIVAITALLIVTLMVVIQVGGGFIDCFVARHRNSKGSVAIKLLLGLLQVAWMSAVSGLLTTALLWAAWHAIPHLRVWRIVGFAPPLVAASVIAGVMLLVGLMGADYPDAAREWTARIGARFAMLVVAWTALFALIVEGPPAVAELIHRLPRVGPAAIATWLATTLGGVLAGRSPQTASGEGKSPKAQVLETLVNVAPTMFLIAYVMAIAAGTHALLARVAPPSAVTVSAAGAAQTAARPADSDKPRDPVKCCCCSCDDRGAACRDTESTPVQQSAYATNYQNVLTLVRANDGLKRVCAIVLLLGLFVVISLVASSRINVNEFSLHHFYKNRLVRCYLGASRSKRRKPNTLTGFDPADDFPLASLSADPDLNPDRPYYGPYPIVNATLNLNAGSELAQQERKAASFVFTPAFCGFDPPSSREHAEQATDEGLSLEGYRRTRRYSQPAGPAIGTTMAISGAAASPNWGYHTSGPVAFLLTVFNARLGWWLGNPRWDKASEKPGPVLALVYLIAELLGQTTGRSKFVNLSDGGHFDNLGLYELVRRRCRLIIVCDAEEDAGLTFGSLGAAIRKCRADFGVEIDINPDPIRKGADGFSRRHCVVGRIRYPEPETAFCAGMTGGWRGAAKTDRWSRGWILYLKSSLTGDEPADVIEYRSRFSEFPHQSTADQFFSESQFESYRRLGYHALRSAFEDIRLRAATPGDPHPQYPLVTMFQDLTSKWYAGLPVTPEAATRLADAYVALMESLGKNQAATDLFQELNSGGSSHQTADPSSELIAAGMAVIQVIQNVYTEFGFEHAFNTQNPRNGGWLKTFRKWVKSPILIERIWPRIKDDYHPLFQEFIEDLRHSSDPPEPEVL